MRGMPFSLKMILLMLVSGCASTIPGENESFRDFVRRLPVAKKGFEYDISNQDLETSYVPRTGDTAFLPHPWPVLGVLEDTSRFFQIIQLYPADDHTPLLFVFSKFGKLLGQGTVGDELCAGKDCRTDSCRSWIQYSVWGTIESRVVLFTSECDSIGMKIPGTNKQLNKTSIWNVSGDGNVFQSTPDTRKVWK